MTARGEGWYADPQDPAMLRWWDGTRWTMHTHDLAAAHRPPLPRWWSGLTVVLQIALLANVAASLFVLYVDQEILSFVEELRLRPDTVTEADGTRIDELMVDTTPALLAWLGTGVLFIVWSYTLHQSERMDRTVLRHGSGWAIGGWFVPVLNFWRPFQMVLDVRRGATGQTDLPVTRTLGWWWGTFWLSYATGLVSSFHYNRLDAASDDDPVLDHFAGAATWERTSEVIAIVSALLAIAVVREVRSLARPDRGVEAT